MEKNQKANSKLNKSSKIFQEFNNLINGNNKINIVYFKNERHEDNWSSKCLSFLENLRDVRIPLIKAKKMKTPAPFIESEDFI